MSRERCRHAVLAAPVRSSKGVKFTLMDNLPATDSLHAQDEDIEQACQSIKGLAHPIRLKVLCILGSGEMSVSDLARECSTSQANISSHLSILRQSGILTTRREAHTIYYRIRDPRMIQLMDLMRMMFCSRAHH